jgi:uncharacterized protein YggE
MRFLKFAAVAACAAAFAAPAAAQTADHSGNHMAMHGIEGTLLTISAEGTTDGNPDMAVVNLGVTTDGATAQAALTANSQRMNALTQALRRAGIAERDIQTSNISVNPQYQYQENQPPRLTGYQATNTVVARVRNVSRVGAAIDAAVAAGGNTVNGVSFTFQDTVAQLDAARRNAVQAARSRAELYATAFGLHIQRIIAISEGGGYSPPMPMPMYARMAADSAPPPPVSPGEITTSASISVTYELR